MSIKIGETYKDFEGNSIKIVSFMKYNNKKYPFIGIKQCNNKEYSYNEKGQYLESKHSNQNLIIQ